VSGAFFTAPESDVWLRMVAPYCVGPKLIEALKKEPQDVVTTVHYILKTAANWKGPIKKFRLTLVKASPKDRISVCIADTRRVSPTTFEVVRENFVPTEDLKVLFIPGPPK
jgi:hypothetical protein